VSFSFREPEWPTVCECKYDEVRDEVDRDDCSFHDDSEYLTPEEIQTPSRKKSVPTVNVKESAA
jgi:hypothetical protein